MDLRDRIFTALHEAQEPRFYMGASMMGHECDRKVWLDYRGFKGESSNPYKKDDHPGRVFAIFQAGHDIEEMLIKALGDIVEDEQVPVSLPPIKGHADGVLRIDGKRELLEIKSANKRRFKLFKEKGVEETEPKYFVQMQVYMHLLLLHQGRFLVMCKDDSEIHVETVAYNRAKAQRAIERGMALAHSGEPDKIDSSGSHPLCTFCEYRRYCHASIELRVAKKACLNCAHLSRGHCVLHKKDIEHPERDCDLHAGLEMADKYPF